jgi:outer membrane usher protein
LGGQNSGTLTAAGGIIAVGDRVFLTRPVQNGFALVKGPGASIVECEWSNQPVGKTDRAGDCLYPNLLPYFGNQLGINDKDIPLNYSVGATQKTVAVPYRGGAVIAFRSTEFIKSRARSLSWLAARKSFQPTAS